MYLPEQEGWIRWCLSNPSPSVMLGLTYPCTQAMPADSVDTSNQHLLKLNQVKVNHSSRMVI